MSQSATTRQHINLSGFERWARMLVGGAGTLGAVLWYSASPTLVVGAGAVLLAAAGLDLVVTGARGHCPLYAWLARRKAGGAG